MYFVKFGRSLDSQNVEWKQESQKRVTTITLRGHNQRGMDQLQAGKKITGTILINAGGITTTEEEEKKCASGGTLTEIPPRHGFR